MRICFTNDVHGRPELYEQLAALVATERPQLLIVGGDMFPDGDEADPPASQRAFVRDSFAATIDAWKRSCPGLAVAAICGNHDWLSSQQELAALDAAGRLTLLTPQRTRRIADLTLLGFSHTPPTPFHVKDFERLDQPGDEIPQGPCFVYDPATGRQVEIDPESHFVDKLTLAEQLAAIPPVDDARWLFVCHAPPFETPLDVLPNVDHPVGSHSIRAFIEQHQPYCALHGHIHESPAITGAYRTTLGQTLCVNPGQAHETLHAVLFDSDDPAGTMRHTVFG